VTIRDEGDINRMVDPPEPDPLEMVARLAARGFPGAVVERLRESVQITIPGEEGVSALLTAAKLEVHLPTVHWTGGAHTPVAGTRFYHRYVLKPAISETTALDSAGKVRKILKHCLAARRREFLTCRYCKKRVPPEHRHAKDGATDAPRNPWGSCTDGRPRRRDRPQVNVVPGAIKESSIAAANRAGWRGSYPFLLPNLCSGAFRWYSALERCEASEPVGPLPAVMTEPIDNLL
jgi:hypothetical protein